MLHQVYRCGPRLESPPQPDYVPGSMDKQAIRQVLEQIASLLELKGETPFRVRAFQNAGRAIAGFPGDVAAAAASGELAEVPGIGRATLEIVRELAATGRSSALEDLREQVPPGLVDMLRVPGLGVAKVRQIHDRLRVTSLPELEAAAADGRLAELPRFGAKTAENVRSEEHTSELQSLAYLVCRLLLEKKKKTKEPRQATTPCLSAQRRLSRAS